MHRIAIPSPDHRPEPVARPGRARGGLRLIAGGGAAGVARTHATGGGPAEELWRQVDELAGVVRLVEEERAADGGGARPAPAGVFAVLFDESEEAEDALMEALAFSDLYDVLVAPGGADAVRCTGHPEAGTVLDVAARVLPDARLARDARKAALKARTV